MKTSLLCLLFMLFCLTSGQRRIVGGSDAEDGMYPYAAFLLIDDVASCTGSLLSDSWVLTAAHCFPKGPYSNAKVVAGAANRKSNGTQERHSIDVKIHPYYVRNARAASDIALVMTTVEVRVENNSTQSYSSLKMMSLHQKGLPTALQQNQWRQPPPEVMTILIYLLTEVNKPFNFNSSNIGFISLTSVEWPQGNQMNVRCKALGWGRISTYGKVPDILQHLDVIAKHGSEGCPCVKRYEQKKLVCLEGVAGSGPCMGDSGGPLVCNGREIGITHMGFTKESCNPVYPDVPRLRCGAEDTVVTYIYICPELNWIRKYVSGVPRTPASCSARAICRPHFKLILLTVTYIFISINTLCTVCL